MQGPLFYQLLDEKFREATHSVDFMALFQGFTPLSKPLVGKGRFCLEPHALHLIEVVYSRHSFLTTEKQGIRHTICILTKIRYLLFSSVFPVHSCEMVDFLKLIA